MSADEERELLDGLRIEPFDPTDLDALMEIENSSFTLPWSRQSYEELWPVAGIAIWVARLDHEMAGYMLLQTVGEEMELHTFAVRPDLRRRRIGRRLLEFMIEEAQGEGVKRIFLQVRPTNSPARALYEKMGFAAVGIRRRYYRDNDEDAFVMRLDLA